MSLMTSGVWASALRSGPDAVDAQPMSIPAKRPSVEADMYRRHHSLVGLSDLSSRGPTLKLEVRRDVQGERHV